MKENKSFLKPDIGIHIAFILMAVIPSGFSGAYILQRNIPYFIFYIIITNALLLIPTYINAYFWIPRYYNRHKKLAYFFILCVVSVAYVLALLFLYQYQLGLLKMTRNDADRKWEALFYFFRITGYLVISFLLYSLKERFDQKQAITQIKYEKLTSEINHLKSQINPHFLFNTLNNLYGLALEKSDKAPGIILKLSQMMDYMLYETEEMTVYLKKDIENIRNFLDIQRIRHGDNTQIRFECTGDISTQKIVPLLMLPIVENAFKYGLKDMIANGYVEIDLLINGPEVEIKVKNNYNAALKIKNENGHGIGLINLKKRLALFYPEKHTLKIEDEPPVYEVGLKINLG